MGEISVTGVGNHSYSVIVFLWNGHVTSLAENSAIGFGIAAEQVKNFQCDRIHEGYYN